MDILGKTFSEEKISKPEIERVQKEKDEYKLVGKYMRTKGLMLFAYNPMKDELKLIKVDKKKDAVLTFDVGGKGGVHDAVAEECNVDSRNIHFEALNMKSAQKRVQKYKDGKTKELYNLKEPSTEGIKLW